MHFQMNPRGDHHEEKDDNERKNFAHIKKR